ncbi:hypothetical protein BGW38_010296, partial [Lunasporangiospora selenospora]
MGEPEVHQKPSSGHAHFEPNETALEDISPLSTNLQTHVSIRSERSLRSTLPTQNETLLTPGQRPKLSILQCLKAILFASKLNVLLIFIPLGIIAEHLHWSDVTVFILNFIAIVPLAKRYATEEIALRLGE